MRNNALTVVGLSLLVAGDAWVTTAHGQRWGAPGRRSSDWSLTKPYAGRNPLPSGDRTRTYSAAPSRDRDSHSPYRTGRGLRRGVYPHIYIEYNLYGNGYGSYLHPYSRPGLLNTFAPGLNNYPYGYGSFGYGGIYPTITAPPINVPYGFHPSPAYGQVPIGTGTEPAPNFSAPPSASTLIDKPALSGVPGYDNQEISLPLSGDQVPIHDEFGAGGPLSNEVASAVDRIRSLRYQTSGDSAFRRQDFASAAALYQASAETAPNRRAPFLRRSWALVAMEQYPSAVEHLKQALTLPSDGTGVWIDVDDLYGKSRTSQALLHNNELWKWVQQRPASTDRLLLAGAFQKLRGYDGISRELLRTAADLGLDQTLVDSVEALQPPDDPPVKEAIAEDGIRLRGKDVAPQLVGPAEPNAGTGPPTIVIPRVSE